MRSGGGEHAREPVRLAAAQLPAPLSDLSHPPAALWYLGHPSALDGAPGRHVAIVGTREASAYGERTAGRLAAACVRSGLVVVSGLARGVDAAAHRGAMNAGGQTIAVLGTGVDVPYPAGHRTLHAEVQQAGLVLSEMEVGARAMPGCFPRRNRLIAALANVTVVVEAPFKSGAINTAGQALELGRVVAAVPGPIDDPRSAGANLLIRDGAQVITDVDDLLGLFGLSTSSMAKDNAGMDPADVALLSLLHGREQDLEVLAFQSGLPVQHVSQRLLRLEIGGLVVRGGVGYRVAGG